jgi:hypothetical protein
MYFTLSSPQFLNKGLPCLKSPEALYAPISKFQIGVVLVAPASRQRVLICVVWAENPPARRRRHKEPTSRDGNA